MQDWGRQDRVYYGSTQVSSQGILAKPTYKKRRPSFFLRSSLYNIKFKIGDLIRRQDSHCFKLDVENLLSLTKDTNIDT